MKKNERRISKRRAGGCPLPPLLESPLTPSPLVRMVLPLLAVCLTSAFLRADEFDAALDGAGGGRMDALEEISSEMERTAKDKLDHPDWERRFQDALRVTYRQKRPDWSHESTAAYNDWVRQCHEQGCAAFEKLVPEAENAYQRRKACRELVKITEGDARDKWCLLLLAVRRRQVSRHRTGSEGVRTEGRYGGT